MARTRTKATEASKGEWKPPEDKPLEGVKRGERASAELKRALEEGRARDDSPEGSPLHWGSANAAPRKDLAPGYQRIVEHVFIWDDQAALAEYQRLEGALAMGDGRTDRATVIRNLDEAEVNARSAHKLWVSSIRERKRWLLDRETLHAAMRSEANRSLQREKEDGQRNKQITDADIESRMATLFPDEYRHEGLKKTEVEQMEESLKNLAEMWKSRCFSLQKILDNLR